MTIPHQQRATENRGTFDRGQGRVDFVPLRKLGIGDIKALVYVLPKDPVVLEEMKITPKRPRKEQEPVRQAQDVISQAKAGRPVADGEIEHLQQRLLNAERRDQLAGRESKGRPVADALSELRRTQLGGKAQDMLAAAKEGRPIPEATIKKLQQQLLSMDRQDQLAGREPAGMPLATELGEVRRTQLFGRAVDLLAAAKVGRPISDTAIEKLQQRLLTNERQDQLMGRDSEGMRLAAELGEVRRSQVFGRALDLLETAKQGRPIPRRSIEKLQQRLLSTERQDQIAGRESEGQQLAEALGAVRRSQLVAEAQRVLARAKSGRPESDAHLKKLQQLLLSMARQDAIQARESDGLRLAMALAELRRR